MVTRAMTCPGPEINAEKLVTKPQEY